MDIQTYTDEPEVQHEGLRQLVKFLAKSHDVTETIDVHAEVKREIEKL